MSRSSTGSSLMVSWKEYPQSGLRATRASDPAEKLGNKARRSGTDVLCQESCCKVCMKEQVGQVGRELESSNVPGFPADAAKSPGLRADAGAGPAFELKFELSQ